MVHFLPVAPEPLKYRSGPRPVALDDRARDNLRFIRETMERAGSFTALPGWGVIAMGITALGAAVIASQQATSLAWLITWIVEAAIAIAIAGWTMVSKAREVGLLAFYRARPPLRLQFCAASFCRRPAYAVAGAHRHHRRDCRRLAAALWNRRGYRRGFLDSHRAPDGALLHGSRRGGAFLPAGIGAMHSWPPDSAGLHILFGAVIARKYGG